MALMQCRSLKFAGTCYKCGKDMPAKQPYVFNPGSRTGRKGGGTIYCSMECAGEVVVTPRNAQEQEPEQDEAFEDNEPEEHEPMGIEAQLKEMIRKEAASLPAAVDEAKVREIVAAEVAKVGVPEPREIVVKAPDKEAVKIEGGHFLLERVVKLVGAGIPVYLWGPAGTGKTTAALMAAKALSRECEIDTLDPSTFRSMVQGYMTPDGKPVHTSFTRCWETGKLYVADETDNAPGHVQTLFNSALANGHAPLAWGNAPRGELFGFVGTGNTPGMPTRSFPDRRPMSAAFKDRLFFVYWPLDPAIEARLGGPKGSTPKREAHTMTPAEWVAWVVNLRKWAEVNMPTLMVTPRASIIGVQALALGETPNEVADGLVFRGCDAEMRAKAMNAVRF